MRIFLASLTVALVLSSCETELPGASDGPLTVVDLEELEAEDGFVSFSLEAEVPRTRLALMLDLAAPDASFTLEARGEDEAWRPVDITWREGALAVGRLDFGSPSAVAELRFPEEEKGILVDLRGSLLDPEENEDSGDGVIERNQTIQGLSSDLVELGVHSRASWGARSTRCAGNDTTRFRMAVHHTVTRQAGSLAGGRARMRQMQAHHMDGRGWCDIGYHFVVDERGELYEARPLRHRGAHVGGSNRGNLGVSWMGCYHPSGCGGAGSHQVTEAMIDGGGRLLHHLAGRFNITRSSSTVKGHRDHANVNKACPGNRLAARLDDLRSWEPTPDLTPPSWPVGAGLTRVSAQGGAVRVRWPVAEDDIGIHHYRLEAGGRVVTATTTEARIDGLRPYASYLFRVTPVDGAGRSGPALSAELETGAFVDIAGTFATPIEGIARAGITVGCNPPSNDRYCPAEPVAREQMATFLTRALGLPPGPDVFVDDEGSTHEASINAIAAAGITRGCNPPVNDRYCPENVVTRAQMATFLARALELPPGPDVFVDDEGDTHEADINAIAAAGITVGCDAAAARYCPADPVSRGQMAAFLSRALGL